MNLMLVCLSVTISILLCINTVASQAYHFSNGWKPGKKRSPTEQTDMGFLGRGLDMEGDTSLLSLPLSGATPTSECQVRPVIHKLIMGLIEAEIRRLESVCDSQSRSNQPTDDLIKWIQTHPRGRVSDHKRK